MTRPEPVMRPSEVRLEDEDEARRFALLGRLHEDRQDLVRVAGVVRELAETFEVAQSSLSMLRRGLHWLALAGGAAALTLSLRTHRRPPALLLTGLTLYLVQRWLSRPVRHGPASATHPVVGGSSPAARIAISPFATPPPPRRAIAPAPVPARPHAT
ncbi:MAG: hypothetical protein ACREUE_00605 [Panacagrimonas sp.]